MDDYNYSCEKLCQDCQFFDYEDKENEDFYLCVNDISQFYLRYVDVNDGCNKWKPAGSCDGRHFAMTNHEIKSDKESRKTDTAFAQDMLISVGITAIFAFIAFSVIMWIGRFAKNTKWMMDGMTGAYIALIAVIIIMAVSIRLDKVIPNKDDKIRQFSAGKCVNRQTDNRNKEKRS